jgi:hypothetical protein
LVDFTISYQAMRQADQLADLAIIEPRPAIDTM